MKLQSKIIIGIVVVVGALVVIPLILTNYLINKPPESRKSLLDPPKLITRNLETETFTLDEGFSFDKVMTWDLENHEAERAVDRYRFERAGNMKGTFTISFYDQGEYGNFDEVLTARYGEGFIEESEDFDLNGLEARRVLSSFLDVGNTSDILVKTDNGDFLSLYSVHTPEGESAAKILEEINLMQMSFQKAE